MALRTTDMCAFIVYISQRVDKALIFPVSI